MPDNVTITIDPDDSTNITVSEATSAAQTTFDATTSDLTATDLQTAIAALANEKFAQDGTPSSANEGSIWYDTDDDILYVRRNSTWTKLIQENLDGGIDGGTY